MKKKSLNSKLSFHKNTVALLNDQALKYVQGGGWEVVKTLAPVCPAASKACSSEVDPFTCLSVNCPPTSQMIGC